MNTVNFSQLHLIHWALIFLFLALAGFMLMNAVKEFRSNGPIRNNKDKLRRSIRSGLLGGGFWISCLLALFVVYWANIGWKSAVSVSLLIGGCTLPLMTLISIVGSYIQLTWIQGLNRTIDYIGKQEKNKQDR